MIKRTIDKNPDHQNIMVTSQKEIWAACNHFLNITDLIALEEMLSGDFLKECWVQFLWLTVT